MKRVAGGVALAATLIAAAAAARANDVVGTDAKEAKAKSEAELRLDAVQAELDAQRLQILDLKAKLNPAAPQAEGGPSDPVKQYLESEDGKKALDKSLSDLGFAKTGLGTLKFGGLFNVWYTHQRDDETAAGARTGVDTFRLRRAEIIMSGSVVKDLVDFRVMFDPARSLANNESAPPPRNILQDLVITYKGPFGIPKDNLVHVGQFKIPFSREGGYTQSTSKLDFINRADGTTALADARRPGAMIMGTPLNGAVEWFANFHNNNGQNSQDTAYDEKNLVGRVVVNAHKFGTAEASKARTEKLGEISFGGSYIRGNETVVNDTFRNYASDFEWRKAKLLSDKDGMFLRTEWLRSDREVARDADIRSHYYAAGYKVNDNWEGVARHDIFKTQAGDTDRVTDTFGVNYFIKGHNAKIDLNYIRVRQQNTALGRTLVAQWILQFQVAF